jgi:hypothetical protein
MGIWYNTYVICLSGGPFNLLEGLFYSTQFTVLCSLFQLLSCSVVQLLSCSVIQF